MWIVCKALYSDEIEDEKDPLLRKLQSIEDESKSARFCFNTSQVRDFGETEDKGFINLFFYDGSCITVEYDFDEMVQIKKSEDPTIVYTA